MPVNLSSLFSAVNEVSPVNNKEAQSAENAGNTSRSTKYIRNYTKNS